MHFALLDGMRVGPEKGLEGAVCPICKQPVYARCGEERIAHWAHKSVIDCDPWQEPETQWHRDWKNRFGDMQEQMHEKDGARHMADVKTPDGTIVEFRHRFINDEGQRTRQAFFGKTMFWVVDCASNPKRAERFKDNRHCLRREHVPGCGVWSTCEAGECFPRVWINSRRFVFFDFGESVLWCLFPRKEEDSNAIIMRISKDGFVAAVKGGYAKFRERCVEVYRAVTRSKMSAFSYRQVKQWFQDPASSVAPAIAEPRPMDSPVASPEPQTAARPRAVQRAEPEPDPEPVEDVWPEEFDKTVVLALTVDLATGWAIANGGVLSLVTESRIDGDANATGCCAVHCATLCGDTELYWAKRRAETVFGKKVLVGIPEDNELKGSAGCFIGTVEYHAEERLSGKVKLHLRNFKRLAGGVAHPATRECIWRLDPSLQAQIMAVE